MGMFLTIVIDDHEYDGNPIHGTIDLTDKGIGHSYNGPYGSMDRL